MIYLDYSANTPVDEAVLERFCAVERSCPGNANSRHQAGAAAKAAIDEATQSIARSLHVQPAEIIYTSGASEANNFALKSIARLERHHGKHIISTPLEHSSVSGSLTALQEQGYEIDLVDIRQDGTVDLAHLKELLRPDTILVAVTAVDSELGVVQPVAEISALLKDRPHCHFHVDATQAVGKLPVSFEGIDTMSLTAHKFYGLNGIGVLVNIAVGLVLSFLYGLNYPWPVVSMYYINMSLFFAFAGAGVPLLEMALKKANLEDIFIELTEQSAEAPAAAEGEEGQA